MKNMPLFTVSIALQYKNKIVMGVVYDPCTNRLYSAAKGQGAFRNSQQIFVSKTKKIDHAFIYLDISKIHSLEKNKTQEALLRLNKLITETYRVRTLGIGSLGICYLAQGAYEGFFDLTGNTKFLDVATGLIIVKEAGGKLFDIDGKPIDINSKYYIGSNQFLKNEILKIIKIN